MKGTKKFIAWLVAIALLLSGCGSSVSAEPEVTEGREALTDSIAATFASNDAPAEWMVFDLAAYERIKKASGIEEYPMLSEEKKTAYIASAIASIKEENAAVTDFAKAEIILSALGVDTTTLSTDGEEPVSNPENFAKTEVFPTYSDAIWALIADSLDSVTLTDEQLGAAVTKISESTTNEGMLFGSYGGYTYNDPDSTGAAVGALARILDEEDTFGAKALYEKMLGALSDSQLESGSFGSACTDAFVIIGLCAAGIDPETDPRFIKRENSLVDGLMSYVVEGGFSGYDGSLDLEWSTEQGMRALIALDGYEMSDGPYNLYYSAPVSVDKEEEPEGTTNPQPGTNGGGLVADKDVSEKLPEIPEDTTNDDIRGDEQPEEQLIEVTFQMRTHKKTWIATHSVKVERNISVKNLIAKIFEEYGVEEKGLSTGYLRSVTYRGETWGEFDAGSGSGWQYYVNGELPRVGIQSYKLKDGDSVELVYTADYTKDSGNEVDKGSSEEIEEVTDKAEKEEVSGEVWTNPFSDVTANDWFFDAVQFVNEHELMKGMNPSLFEPQTPITRAMFVTVLYRMQGLPDAGEEAFDDVNSDDWFAEAVAWASENGVVNGTGRNTFSPDAEVTREQMATLAYRYAKYRNMECIDKETDFTDSGDISEYAMTAVGFANETGIMTGDGGMFRAKSGAKRCEAAAVFMRLYDFVNK